jgi:hypothetical protein
MKASVAYRWRNAEMLVLAPLFGRRATETVISRTGRKPVQPFRLTPGIPILRSSSCAERCLIP